jgi:sRNA-binding carbon storage regulator CsrA
MPSGMGGPSSSHPKDMMLVIARKRSETLIIDGTVRVEVLGLSGGMARLRFLTPSRIPISRGVARHVSTRAVEAGNAGVDASGMDPVATRVVDLTLAKTQVLTLGTEIHIGLVDIDSTRALLFVDAPGSVAVQAGETEKPTPRRLSRAAPNRGQGMLAFPPHPATETDENRRDSHRASTGSTLDDSHSSTIPFKRPED